MAETKDFKPQQRVIYIPMHVDGDRSHPDCRWGTVSSINERCVFVKFDEQTSKLGWDGTTSQGCNPNDLQSWATVN